MIRLQWSRKHVAVAVAMIVLAGIAGLMRPQPFFDSGLGASWQCSKTAGILVTCTYHRS